MNALHKDLKDQGLEVIAVNLDEETAEAEAFLASNTANMKLAADPDMKCARNFNVKAMPSSYIIDQQGVIRHVHLGFRHGEAKDLRVFVERLLTDKTAQIDHAHESY